MDAIGSFLSGGLIGGFIGGFLGGFSKFFWERWLPDRLTWKREQKVRRRKLLATERDPAVRAISELQGRLWVILDTEAGNYEYVKNLGQGDYYIDSTAFLVAQYFAWSERMRRQIAALDYTAMSLRLEAVTDAFSHGGPGFQVFRLEQREIAERLMLACSGGPGAATFEYSAFLDLASGKETPGCLRNLRQRSKHLLEQIDEEEERATRIQHALIDLLDFVDAERRWVRPGRREKYGRDGESQALNR
jgi:hypothetical protein